MGFNIDQKDIHTRALEQHILEKYYEKSKNQAQLVALTGKIRLGKTQLLKDFFKHKPHIYYLASQSSSQDQLQAVVEIFTREFDDSHLNINDLPSWAKFFEYLDRKLKIQKKPIIIVFDEFTKLIKSDSQILSAFEIAWDKLIKTSKVMVILVDSSVAQIHKLIFDPGQTLSKKFTGQINLKPYTFKEIYDGSKAHNFEQIFKLYSLVGGVPAYLKALDPKKSIKENIIKKILAKNSFLSIEPNLLISDEFNDPKIYLSILKALGATRLKYSQLLNATGLTASKLPIYLKNLLNLEFVKRELPITIHNPEISKKANYSISDHFLRLYFSITLPNLSLIEEGNFEALFKNCSPNLDHIFENTYSDIAKDFITEAATNNLLPGFDKIGPWWDTSDQISILGLNHTTSKILFCDTFWSNRQTTLNDLKMLYTKSKKVDWQSQKREEYYCLISKKGFTLELLNYAKEHRVLLIEGDKPIF
jgi:AAA+ ATPase superfamily predicted ATPase